MKSTDNPQIEAFRNQLQRLGAEFVCTAPVPAPSVSLSFLGKFQGKTVVWNMTLSSLLHLQSNVRKNNSVDKTGGRGRQFIEISESNDGVFPILVGLDLAQIDEPVIKKTIIMIRNYKRLVVGKIEFGSMHT